MKRLIVLLLAAGFVLGVQASDSLRFVNAKRTSFIVPGAKGYFLQAELFGAPQTISVIKLSQKKFRPRLVQTDELATTSWLASSNRAICAINAGYWSRDTTPATYLRIDGHDISTTARGLYHRVNGVVLLDGEFDVVSCMPDDYEKLAAKHNNLIAVGPVLIDEGSRISYEHVKNGHPDYTAGAVRFFHARHPRSVIGRNAKGEVFLVVVDGRNSENAAGMSIYELGNLCVWLGLTDAINLDGGGSSTLWSSTDGVINHPCDNRKFDHEGERAVSSAILFLKRK